MAIELRVVQFWSEIILVISNRTHAARSFDFEITRMISNQIALHSAQLPLCIVVQFWSEIISSTRIFTTRGYVWPVETLHPDYLAPKQLAMYG